MATGKTPSAGFLGALVERMKNDKKFELAVYAVLILIGVLIFVFSSCEEGGWRAGAAPSREAPASDELEDRLAGILSSIEGAGAVQVMIVRDEAGDITGAIVTARGAADISVRERLRSAVRTVLGIGMDQVEIFQMEKNNSENAEG